MPASRTFAASRHVLAAMLEAALVVAIIFALFLAFSPVLRPDDGPVALAGKPVGGSGAVVVPNGTFTERVTATASAAYYWVHARCSQGGVVVYEQWVKTDGARHGVITLGPTPMWQSGAASCWAEDGRWSSNGRWRQSTTTTFSVSG